MSPPGRVSAGALVVVVAPLAAVLLLGLLAPAYADETVFRWQDPAITESSGLVVVDGRFVTVNDSGNSAELFVADPATGATVRVVPWADSQVDVEGLAPGPDGSVWVGDIGDNLAARPQVTVTRVPLDGRPPTTYVLRYPDGAHDAETLLRHPDTGRLYVVTKSLVGEVYAAPAPLRRDRPNRLTLVGSVGPGLTDGAFWPDGEHVLLRGYGLAFVYSFPGLELRGSVELPSQQQGEAIAVSPSGSVFVSSEGVGTPVWQVDLPSELVSVLAGGASASGSGSAEAEDHGEGTAATGAGVGADAEPREDEPRRVWGRSPTAGVVLGAAGVLLAMVGAVIWWRNKGDRS